VKTIIAGSRDIVSYGEVEAAVKASGFTVTQVVSGSARGADQLGERYASENRLPIKQFIPDWDRIGKSAGYRRNEDMARYAEAAIILWDGASKGTKHMIDFATKQGLKVYVHHVRNDRPAVSTAGILLTSYNNIVVRPPSEMKTNRRVFSISRSAPAPFKNVPVIKEAVPSSWELVQLGKRDFMAYTKQFMAELDVDALLHRINVVLMEDGPIALCCWCRDPNMCHRSLIGKVLRERGFTVDVQ
jgi:hypothetical protein